MKASGILTAAFLLASWTCGATVVLNTDLEADTIGSDPAMSGTGDIGGAYVAGGGDQSVQANPEASGNTSAKVLFGGDQTANFNQGVLYFAGGSQPIDGLSIAYDFYCANNGGNANEGVRVALRNSADDANAFFLRNDRDGTIKINGADHASPNAGQDIWQHFSGTFILTAPGFYDFAWAITNLETGTEVAAGIASAQDLSGGNLADGLACGLFLEMADPDDPATFQGYIDNVHVVSLAHAADPTTPPVLLVGLDPALAAYDGGAVDDGGSGGSASGITQPVLENGFAFNVTFIPSTADSNGTVMVAEIGGTSNGSGIYLVNGVPTFISKQGSSDGVVQDSLADTGLPAVAVQSTYGALSAGTEYTLAATWDHAGILGLAVFDGSSVVPDTFATTGSADDWSGNETLSVGIKSNNGSTGGLSGNNSSGDFGVFDVTQASGLQLPCNIVRAMYWNDYASFVAPTSVYTRVNAGAMEIGEGLPITISWETTEVTAFGSVEFSSDYPASFSNQTGTATSGTIDVYAAGGIVPLTVTLTFKTVAGAVEAVRDICFARASGTNDVVRPWLSPDHFSVPLYDWQNINGTYACIKAGAGRVVHYLPNQLQPSSALNTSVKIARVDAAFAGAAGFRFAIRGALLDDFRHNIVHGSGYDAGLRTDGTLFVGDQQVAAEWEPGTTYTLEFSLMPSGGSHLAELVLKNGALTVASVQKSYPSSDMSGNLALMCEADSDGQYGSPLVLFDDWQVSGSNLRAGESWGPILWAQHTLSKGTLKLTAQFPPIATNDNHTATLEIDTGSGWSQVASALIDDEARVALFKVPGWDDTADTPYRVVYELDGSTNFFPGTVRRDPVDEDELSVAVFTGNTSIAFPNHDIVSRVAQYNPDMLFFTGDQLYENDYAFGGKVTSPVDKATLDYLRKWYFFGWAFRDVMRDRPTITIPDDHDAWGANLFGSGGNYTTKVNDGGYLMPGEWVNMMERTQTANLPDPYDPAPIEQGIGAYFTDLLYGRVSFAILEDRKFKSGFTGSDGEIPLEDKIQLGDRQLAFVDAWARDWSGADMKATLHQTVFDQCHSHAGEANEYTPKGADEDANGWPSPARTRSVTRIRKAFANMIGGDNHLPTVAHIGIDDWEDAGVSFSCPSIAAGYPRKWDPVEDPAIESSWQPGWPDYVDAFLSTSPTYDGKRYLGRYRSRHNHPLTMVAAANPDRWGGNTAGDVDMLDRKSSGFGVVRFNKRTRDVTIECWRILGDLNDPARGQFDGWPVTHRQSDNYGRDAVGYLPVIEDLQFNEPVVEVLDETSGELVYSIRAQGRRFRPHVFSNTTYSVRYGDPETDTWVTRYGQAMTPSSELLRTFEAENPYIIIGEQTRLLWDAPGADGAAIDSGIGDVSRRMFNGVGSLEVAPTADTAYTLTTTNSTLTEQASVLVRVFQTLEQWQAVHFTPGELLNPAISADDADPDKDGIANILEYVMMTDPWADSRSALPNLNIVPDPQGAAGTLFLEMTARGILQVNNARYVVQYSEDLVDWFDLDVVQMLSTGVAQSGGANQTDTLGFASDAALPSSTTKGFYRVQLQAE
ncbi:hypothetical protein PDESU_01865 [Pontiella desulfatans]|uniref:PhoD-like phosphatase metallophosphatase domain-containing protein n=1 Tax=Pontiella desulfatans TaxID=2750659 RepID=A0A6C2U0G3_PONDE|nr:hypothetical protein [Pontiella desulfatans]VGO13309.1 hypothetical protein PDESU_01865 [Pontiella desulfatans]